VSRFRALALTLAAAAMAAAASCGGGSDAVVGSSPGAPTLLAVQAQVLTPRCALSGCHVTGTAPFGLDMSSAASSAAHLIGVASGEKPAMLRVAAGDSANSYMYWKLSGNPNINGDPMPASGGPLSPADLALIAAWIDGGAK
jgi:hypothetical protein